MKLPVPGISGRVHERSSGEGSGGEEGIACETTVSPMSELAGGWVLGDGGMFLHE